jgi:hypothetical protein
VPTISGDDLLTLLGRSVDDAAVQKSLGDFAHGMQPDRVFEDDELLVDWVTVNELGVEYGFEDEAFVKARDPRERNCGSVLLTQLYFYGDTPKTRAFPYSLPFGVGFHDERRSVRRKLGEYEATLRSYLRDAWRLPGFDVTVAYRGDSGMLESVFCHVPYTAWPPLLGEAARLSPFTPEVFVALFGLRWSSPILRSQLRSLGYEETLRQVRGEHSADLKFRGLELVFAPSAQLVTADQQYSRSPALAGVTYYSSRELDARAWAGALPLGLSFTDCQADIRTKLGRKPAEISDQDRSGTLTWEFDEFTLIVMYSNIENRVLRITMLEPSFWRAAQSDDEG